MDQLEALRQRIRLYLVIIIALENIILFGLWSAGLLLTDLPPLALAAASLGASAVITLVIIYFAGNLMVQPVQALWQVILHLSPNDQGVPPLDASKLKLGRELVVNLTGQLNQLVNVARKVAAETEQQSHDLSRNFVAQNLPLPLITLDADGAVKFVNAAAEEYLGSPAASLQGQNIYLIMDMAFPSQDTFDSWLKAVKAGKATAAKSWERVRLNVHDNHPARLFDLAAYYNRDNPDNYETILTIFDHTNQYSQDDQAISFIALTVHELRTPLTLLRGYIEVFEDELDGSIGPELKDFMQKMRAQAEQLTAFVNNILNVARVDDDQLELHLAEADWPTVLKSAVSALSLQAKVRGIQLRCRIATNLPSVGVDRLSIQEVISNLIDNAIKYSGDSKTINIEARLTKDGLVETTVQDFGVGIPTNVMQHLFTKFYRDHRNRAQIGGTGLGLYLSKAIVDAHGGQLWVRSKPGEGSTFGFTLTPYAKLAQDQKNGGDQGMTRSAHGWIKNHSLYRR